MSNDFDPDRGWQRPPARPAPLSPSAAPDSAPPVPALLAGPLVTVVPDPTPLSGVTATAPDLVPEADPTGESYHVWFWFLAAMLGGVVFLLALSLTIVVATKKSLPKGADPERWAAASGMSDMAEVEPQELDEVDAAEDRDSRRICPEQDGEVRLEAADAALRGGLRQVSRGDQTLIVNWRTRAATAEWRFLADHRGVYRAEVTCCAAPDAGAGKFLIEVDGEPYERSLSGHGEPGVLKTEEFFLVIRDKGEHVLVCRALTPTRQGLMHLRSIRLVRLSIL